MGSNPTAPAAARSDDALTRLANGHDIQHAVLCPTCVAARAPPMPPGYGAAMRPPPAILVLAAGASSRMRDADKLMEPVDGVPLVLRAVRAACAVADEVLVALPADDAVRRAALADTPARQIALRERAMSASIRAGVAACHADALTIHLADMPEIGADDLRAIAEAWSRTAAPILRAAGSDGTPGQPVTFHRALFGELLALTGDGGARTVLPRHEVTLLPLPGRRALIDLDTPEAWAAWRAERGLHPRCDRR